MCTDVPGMNYILTSDFVVVLLKICLTGCLFFTVRCKIVKMVISKDMGMVVINVLMVFESMNIDRFLTFV